MKSEQTDNAINLHHLTSKLRATPIFQTVAENDLENLVNNAEILTIYAGDIIVAEHALIDSIYFIINGTAEVLQSVKKKHGIVTNVSVATLHADQWLGLTESGFYSETMIRTATVRALTNVSVLRINLKTLNTFLQQHHTATHLHATIQLMLRMHFIKQVLPFTKISLENLKLLAEKVTEKTFAPNEVIFKQNTKGDTIYLIRKGSVEISEQDTVGNEKQLAILKPPAMFGETSMLLSSQRNASAKALEETEVLCLQHDVLTALIAKDVHINHVFMNLMINRSKPKKIAHITLHSQITVDREEVMVLKNAENGNYFKLSKEGAFIWQLLDGEHTLQELTLALSEEYNVFAPDVVSILIARLNESGFIENIYTRHKTKNDTKFTRWVSNINDYLDWRIPLGDVDKGLSFLYQKFVRYLFTLPAQALLLALAVVGVYLFQQNTSDVLIFFNEKHAGLFVILAMLPLSLLATFLHELGHAFAMKAFGREVHQMGIGWCWITPVAFTDTTDIWLSGRKERMLVNAAGVYVDMIVAGIATLVMLLTHDPYFYSLCWIFAFYTYFGAFRKLNPFQETDGYYFLMDVVQKNHLKRSTVLWAAKWFPQPKAHIPELIYCVACLSYVFAISLVTLLVQSCLLRIFGVQLENLIFTLIVPITAALIVSVRIMLEVKNAEM